ncbi:MAG: tRNA epoxyqueuosine(34) reductase QueG [Proteobacteria bacterium]|nr:tRNA epoxyqueuosine(34) reductase QueG [Pseudomonadota bacterium]
MAADLRSCDGLDLDVRAVVESIRRWAHQIGFQHAAVANIALQKDEVHLSKWLKDGFHGTMSYMERNGAKRAHPESLVPGTISVISLRMDYMRQSVEDSLSLLDEPGKAYIARYALGRDYHKVLRSRLKRLAQRLEGLVGPFGYRVFTDSAPVLERALARNAGHGWIGKHTNLINRHDGSLFFLGEIFTDLPLEPERVFEGEHCGSCTRCIDICPTGAIVAPFKLDARRCISYLTIEYKGSIPEALRPSIGNRIFGCDDCQLVCPWNRYARMSAVADFAPRHGLDDPDLVSLFSLNESEFDTMTQGSAIRRISYEQWLRNLAVAMGNAPFDVQIVRALQLRRKHPSVIVREHVEWALTRQAAHRA